MRDRATDQLFVKSHVARDLLQNAGLFKTDKLVVWEYVSNSLEYVDPGTAPVVLVTLDSKRKRIAVEDNGSGMDWAGLQNFFVMHAENIARKQNRPGRGRFGTGKSAAFGIANSLRIKTVRAGKRLSVQLARSDLEAMGSEAPVPVHVLESEVPTNAANGTLVEIEEVNLRSLDPAGVIRYIERHLARWPKNVTVFVNNHECEFLEPSIAFERKYRPDGMTRAALGDVELTIKVAKEALDEELRGVSIFSEGVWYETTLAGSEGRDMAQYLFGEIDVPALDRDKSPISPFDVSRTMRLNPNNDLVQMVLSFVGEKVEEVRRDLARRDRERRASEEARRLSQQADEIARLINEDFEAFRQRLHKARARATGSGDLGPAHAAGGSSEDDLLFGNEVAASVVAPSGGPGRGKGSARDGEQPPNLAPQVTPGPEDAPRAGRPAGGPGPQATSRGGFHVEFKNMGAGSHRAKYVRDERTIYINLDHPQLTAARGVLPVEDISFRRLAYEIAFAEYAIALASELAAKDEYLDPSDPIVDIRDTLNRLARRAASLYTA